MDTPDASNPDEKTAPEVFNADAASSARSLGGEQVPDQFDPPGAVTEVSTSDHLQILRERAEVQDQKMLEAIRAGDTRAADIHRNLAYGERKALESDMARMQQ